MSRDDATDDQRPLVAVLCATPILAEAVTAALEGMAEVRRFPAGRPDVYGLLRWLGADAVVVDRASEASEAAAYGIDFDALVVHILLPEEKLRLLRDGRWEQPGLVCASAEGIRNVLIGSLFGRGALA